MKYITSVTSNMQIIKVEGCVLLLLVLGRRTNIQHNKNKMEILYARFQISDVNYRR